ncbi:MAG TPA: hypothetical protein VIT62_02270 [Lysobacter sp.]
MKTLLFLIALSATSLAYAADGNSATSDKASSAPAAAADGKQCEKKKEVGSNVATRVCTTEAERVAAKAKAQADVERLGRCSGNEKACSGSL